MIIGGINVKTSPISQASFKDKIRKVYPCPVGFTACPFCGKAMKDYVFAVAVSDRECIKPQGYACYKCDALFTVSSTVFNALEHIRLDKDAYQLKRDFDLPYDIKRDADIRNAKRSICRQVTLCVPGDIRVYTIVAGRSEVDVTNRVIHYSHPFALELLTAIRLNKTTVELEGKPFSIVRVRDPAGSKNSMRILEPSSYVAICSENNGGYYSPDEDAELVDGLVFCEKSQRLEVLAVSYSKARDLYYVDRQKYNSFVRAHGWPIVTYVSHDGDGWSTLRDESLLHMLGYNVGAAAKMSDRERHALLARMVELDFVTISSAVTLLKGLIRRNGAKEANAEARIKWQDDHDFISTYKVNPERAVFLSKIKKKPKTRA